MSRRIAKRTIFNSVRKPTFKKSLILNSIASLSRVSTLQISYNKLLFNLTRYYLDLSTLLIYIDILIKSLLNN